MSELLHSYKLFLVKTHGLNCKIYQCIYDIRR